MKFRNFDVYDKAVCNSFGILFLKLDHSLDKCTYILQSPSKQWYKLENQGDTTQAAIGTQSYQRPLVVCNW